jgi:hypothetical protein
MYRPSAPFTAWDINSTLWAGLKTDQRRQSGPHASTPFAAVMKLNLHWTEVDVDVRIPLKLWDPGKNVA